MGVFFLTVLRGENVQSSLNLNNCFLAVLHFGMFKLLLLSTFHFNNSKVLLENNENHNFFLNLLQG